MLKLQFKDKPQRSFWLVGEQLTLGCDSGSDVVLEGLGILGQHALITINGDQITLCPEESGQCYLNDQLVEVSQLLTQNDEIRIGRERLLVIDPKTLTDKKSAKASTASKAEKLTIWSLTADHPKLKDKPYLITNKSILGRSKEVNLFIPYKHLSREHAELSLVEGGLQLKDLGSSNGCFVNGERVKEYLLTGGETVSFAFLDFTVNSPTSTDESASLNATMVRTAITQEDIEKAQQVAVKASQALDLSEINQQFSYEEQKKDKPNYWVWGGVMLILLVGLGYGWVHYAI